MVCSGFLSIVGAMLCATCLVVKAWSQDASLPVLTGLSFTTTTRHYHPGDPLNVGLIGTQDQVIALMKAAGWQPADPVTMRTSAHIIRSVAFRRAYLTAPVSPLFYLGRRQDLAFEKQVGASARQRHHVRFWKARDEADGTSLWLGDATFDRSVGFTHRGAVTHHIDGDIDQERNYMMDDLGQTKLLSSLATVPGQGPRKARNGGGDFYWTDGNVALGVIKAP